MTAFDWTGVFPALLTPFKKDDTLDLEMFAKNLKAQAHAGVDGIIIGGSLGEASTITEDEITELYDTARTSLPSAMPIIINIAEQATRVACRLAKDAEDFGADGLMLLPPMRYAADSRETTSFFKEVAKATSLPVMLYNNPIDYKIPITLAMFEELQYVENITAVKESTRDITNITRMINRFGKRFKILCGVDTIALEALVSGADGWVAGLVNAFPAETVAIYRLVKAGKLQEALAIHRWFMPVLELDIHPKLVQYIKMAAVATGIGSEQVRAPRLVLEGDERKKVEAIIRRGLKARPTFPDYLNLN